MKKTFVFAALLATALVAHAETLKVKIPFSFTATGIALPAGEYSISSMNTTASVLLIKSTSKADDQAFVFGRIVRGAPGEKPAIVFDKKALVGVTAADAKFELSASAK